MVVSLENVVFDLIFFVLLKREGLYLYFLLMFKNLLFYCLNLSDLLFRKSLGVFNLLFAAVVKNIHLLDFQRDFIELLLDKVFSALACDQVVITVVFCREHIFFVFCNSLGHFGSICFLFGQSQNHIIV